MLPGVYRAVKKDGSVYYRSSITYKNKHISLGSYPLELQASGAYEEAGRILNQPSLSIDQIFSGLSALSFEKAVTLCNFRDNGIYIKNPIYLRTNYFEYYLSREEILKFDIDDLFYYSSHKLMKRGGHLFVNEYGMQYSVLARYGIKNHAVCGRDYQFANGDSTDYRYSNIIIINAYYGVTKELAKSGITRYRAKIHINGYFHLGFYSTPEKAAIAYNKAVDLAKKAGLGKNYTANYIEGLSPAQYAEWYTKIRLPDDFLSFLESVISD